MAHKIPINGKWKDDRTLAEMNEDDKQQLLHCYKESKEFFFSNANQARVFMGESVKAVLVKLGIGLTVNSDPRFLDKMMDNKKVKIEHRLEYTMDESWRKGIYIYQKGELVAFISHPVVNMPKFNKSMPGRVILTDTDRRFVLRTNAWVVAGKLYQPPAKEHRE